MSALVHVQLESPVATIAMDDGKVNVLSLAMQAQLHQALDHVQAAGTAGRAVVLTGRAGVFSAGFDLPVLRGGGRDALAMLRGGFELAERLLAFPMPVVVAPTGHAIAMALFLTLSADYRIGMAGPFKLTANEVAIGMTMPRAAIEICRLWLAPAHLHRALALAEVFAPDDARAIGMLDRVVPAGELAQAARGAAVQLAELDHASFIGTRQRLRAPMLAALRQAIEADADEFAGRAG